MKDEKQKPAVVIPASADPSKKLLEAATELGRAIDDHDRVLAKSQSLAKSYEENSLILKKAQEREQAAREKLKYIVTVLN